MVPQLTPLPRNSTRFFAHPPPPAWPAQPPVWAPRNPQSEPRLRLRSIARRAKTSQIPEVFDAYAMECDSCDTLYSLRGTHITIYIVCRVHISPCAHRSSAADGRTEHHGFTCRPLTPNRLAVPPCTPPRRGTCEQGRLWNRGARYSLANCRRTYHALFGCMRRPQFRTAGTRRPFVFLVHAGQLRPV